MGRNTTTVMVGVAIAAFAIGNASNTMNFWSTPSHAASMQRFEYKKVRLPIQFTKGSEEILNELGADGWDIAYGFGEVVFMKRIR